MASEIVFWCGKSFITEEFLKHPCFVERNPVKDIVIDFVYETESRDGDKTIHAYDLKGNIYRMTKVNPTKLAELKSSNESKQKDYRDWLRRRGNRTDYNTLNILASRRRVWRVGLGG